MFQHVNSDFQAAIISDAQSFCAAAPYTTTTSSTDCWINGNAASVSNEKKACSINVALCASTNPCVAAGPVVTMTAYKGNAYPQIISSAGVPISNTTTNMVYGGGYSVGLGLPNLFN